MTRRHDAPVEMENKPPLITVREMIDELFQWHFSLLLRAEEEEEKKKNGAVVLRRAPGPPPSSPHWEADGRLADLRVVATQIRCCDWQSDTIKRATTPHASDPQTENLTACCSFHQRDVFRKQWEPDTTPNPKYVFLMCALPSSPKEGKTEGEKVKKTEKRWWPQNQKLSSVNISSDILFIAGHSCVMKSYMFTRACSCNITDLITTTTTADSPSLPRHGAMNIIYLLYRTQIWDPRSHSLSFYCLHLQTVWVFPTFPRGYFNTIMTASSDIQYNNQKKKKCVFMYSADESQENIVRPPFWETTQSDAGKILGNFHKR